MHKFSSLILVLISLFFFSCENTENSVLPTDSSANLTNNLSSQDIDYTPESIKISKTINGVTGGEILLDTTIQISPDNQIKVSFNLTFDPNSFSGTKNITVITNPSQGSIQFSPAMKFDLPAKLDLNYTGIDLKALGFISNSKVDFVYINNNGNIEYILKDEVKIKFQKNQVYTKKALLPHFSRYAFVKKSF